MATGPLLGSDAARRDLEEAMLLMRRKVEDSERFLLTREAALLPIATQLQLRHSNQLYLKAEEQLRARLRKPLEDPAG